MSKDIFTILQGLPCVSLVEPSTKDVGAAGQAFHIHAHKNGREWKLIIHVSDTFPFDLPKISIENAADYQAMGHIDWHGDVCYIDKQGLVIDYNRTQDLILDCVDEALETLDENFNDPHKVELQNDFKSYWESLPSLGFKTTCFVSYDGNVKELTAYRDSRNERKTKKTTCFAVVEDNHGIVNYYYLINTLKGKKTEKSIYIPLDMPATPPSPKQHWNAADIVNVFEALANTNIKKIALNLAKKQKWSNYFTIIFSHPRSDSGHIFWGVQFHRKDTAPHPLLDPKSDWDISPLLLGLHNKEHLLERSANTANLDKNRVAIVGCGSVGSGIAVQLAKAGIGELHLIDFDKMEVENIYRHTLGATALNNESDGFYKTDALLFKIATDIPYTKIVNFNDHLLNLTVKKGFFEYFDAIVIATGDFTCELFLIDYIKH
ncbi:ThiF family adenylyltransferase [Methylomonas sp. CM2]|uniref:ThiF family adenylyltransferase n=1 Tax=Methylomonas sp. CM2 TaxID=3417647 RepID=UPI003CE75902